MVKLNKTQRNCLPGMSLKNEVTKVFKCSFIVYAKYILILKSSLKSVKSIKVFLEIKSFKECLYDLKFSF